ncbi:MAG TPA: hypothetical protein VGB62_03350 [Allosphingosinicella sp.]|jgi:hypothetical protein
MIANLDYVFEPHWLGWIAGRSEHVVTLGGVPVLANLAGVEDRLRVSLAMKEKRALDSAGGLTLVPAEAPSVAELTTESAGGLEAAIFRRALAGSDWVTRAVMREPALRLARGAVRVGLTATHLATAAACIAVLGAWTAYQLGFWAALTGALSFSLVAAAADGLAISTARRALFSGTVRAVIAGIWLAAWFAGMRA